MWKGGFKFEEDLVGNDGCVGWNVSECSRKRTEGIEGVDESTEFNGKSNGAVGSSRVEHCLGVCEFFLLDEWGIESEVTVMDGIKIVRSK